MIHYECDEHFQKEVESNDIIHWNYRNLEFFPKLLKFFGKHVTDLYLKGNCIRTVPKWISEMENLTEIHLTSNNLTGLPEEISKLKFLNVLDVSDNQITELPKLLTSLSELIHLDVSKNLLKKLPEDIGRLKALSFLYASENQISRIPYSITSCPSLREINVNNNNLTSIPKSMVHMPNLEIICVSQNQLLYLPAIPFSTNYLTILAQKNEHLNHISHQVESLNNERLCVKLDESSNEYNSKNFNGLRDELSSNYSKICTEKNSHLVIPMDVYHENETTIPTLQELCLCSIDELIFINNTHTRRTASRKLRSQLPYCMCSEFENGPTAQCQKCSRSLFHEAFIRILWDEKRPKLNIIEYFCSNRCLKLYKLEQTAILWPEIEWKRNKIRHM